MLLAEPLIKHAGPSTLFFTANEQLREFDILEYFACTYPAVVSTAEILEHVWNDQVDPFSNVVRVHLANLRRKLKNGAGEPLIETIIGKGYKLWER